MKRTRTSSLLRTESAYALLCKRDAEKEERQKAEFENGRRFSVCRPAGADCAGDCKSLNGR